MTKMINEIKEMNKQLNEFEEDAKMNADISNS
jgi:hypothetical protein